MNIILGSGSENRKLILERMGYTFSVMRSDIDEGAIRSDDLYELPLLLARAKAEALLPRITEPSILITADQVVLWNGELREKPRTADEARRFLRTYSGSEHPAESVNGIVVLNTKTGERREGHDTSRAYFKKIPEAVIERIVESGKVYHWAGGYNAGHEFFKPYLGRIEGTLESLMGLPVRLTKSLIREVLEIKK